jgi:hypothetical protein
VFVVNIGLSSIRVLIEFFFTNCFLLAIKDRDAGIPGFILMYRGEVSVLGFGCGEMLLSEIEDLDIVS